MKKRVVLAEALRTPIGKFGGALRNVNAEDLAALTIREVLQRSKLLPLSFLNSVIDTIDHHPFSIMIRHPAKSDMVSIYQRMTAKETRPSNKA